MLHLSWGDNWLLYWAFVSACFHLVGFLSALHAVWMCRTSQGAIAWGLSLLLFPYLAVPAYWSLGKDRFSGYVRDFQAASLDAPELIREIHEAAPKRKPLSSEMAQAQVGFEKLSQFPLTTGNQVDLLVDGPEIFGAIFAAIRRAEQYVLVESFIIKADRIGREFQKIVLEKARQGVKVYLIYDELGCWSVPRSFFHELREAGVEVVAFAPGGWAKGRLQINFRNHRKIIVVDGEVAFVGGINVSDDTLGRTKFYGPWRDTHVRVRGPAVLGIQLSFLGDYYWATGGKVPAGLDWKPRTLEDGPDAAVYVAAGPNRGGTGLGIFLHSIQSARHRIWLATPYFLPTAPVLAALKMAVLRGVEVKVLLPLKRDMFLTYMAAFNYLPEALEAGIEIYRYSAGYAHQKVMLIDDELSWVGSSNLDARSLELNFEGNLVVFGKRFAAATEKMLRLDLERCHQVQAGEAQKQSFLFNLGVRFSRLFENIL